ncbi:ornithine carbamoyltransferase [Myceligenerans pegani]|uniref:Ornithine carbamoyltransferase n=1 Tax=Myceligenerans pegani TaxID=2776917 RepID=A0ABR9MYP3_9MICO|nr:ornithine carbamoyltransferase [Myceligenerans sp. TRM 65318]MBE1876509.1 ornithine carbamoyltransferase [Myceligenerans sp. TRM 65318]MBE3018780.1 ornithine carbamoyltransferase [Myceligenerans sp. TRM 65318]
MTVRHFLADDDLTPAEQREVLDLAMALRGDRLARRPLEGRRDAPGAIAFITDKPTLRTQLSFAGAIADLGGQPIVVDGNLAQIGARESVEDTARVLGRQVAAIVWRTYGQDRLETMAAHAGVPVVNALTDAYHPCQILADLVTIAQHRGGVAALPGTTLAYVGDAGNNMAASYLLGGATAGLHVRIGGPEGFRPDPGVLTRAARIAERTGGSVVSVTAPEEAVSGADVVATDTWVSMGDDAAGRETVFEPYQVNAGLLAGAAPDAVVLHCLPAYRGKEITEEVLEGPRSVVWDEAENRLHAQKALLAWLLEEGARG